MDEFGCNSLNITMLEGTSPAGFADNVIHLQILAKSENCVMKKKIIFAISACGYEAEMS